MSAVSVFANFATLVGVYDGTLFNGATIDTSTNIGSGDLSLTSSNNQYLLNTNTYVSPPAVTGNGISFSGWFYPTGPQSTNSVIFDVSSASSPSAVTLSCSTASITILTGTYNGVSVSTAYSNPVNLNAWNFFTYIVDCSGTTAYQLLYLNNGAPVTNTAATYSGSVPYTTNTLGYRPGLTYFNGKIDDYRYYNRVLTPPEINVLLKYNYKSTASALTPVVYVSKDAATVTGSSSIILDLSGTFSYVTILRAITSGTSGSSTSFNISASAMVPSNNFNYTTWTDIGVAAGNMYTYTVTPYIVSTMGTYNTVTISI
jgi:hypothetical protein